jgi:hypothetical protein
MQEAIVRSTILAAVLGGPFALGVLFGYLRWHGGILPTALVLLTAASIVTLFAEASVSDDAYAGLGALIISALAIIAAPPVILVTTAGWLLGKRLAPGGTDATAR